jgi:hypothetical protein
MTQDHRSIKQQPRPSTTGGADERRRGKVLPLTRVEKKPETPREEGHEIEEDDDRYADMPCTD